MSSLNERNAEYLIPKDYEYYNKNQHAQDPSVHEAPVKNAGPLQAVREQHSQARHRRNCLTNSHNQQATNYGPSAKNKPRADCEPQAESRL